MELKDWIKGSRRKVKLTQEQLGELLGFTKANISSLESGRHEPSWWVMLKISEITSCPLPVDKKQFELMAQRFSEDNGVFQEREPFVSWPFPVSYKDFMALGQEAKEVIYDTMESAVKRQKSRNLGKTGTK